MIDKFNKLLFFPDPYPEELMYSVLARFHFYNLGLPYGSSQEKLFGSKRMIPKLHLIFQLDELVKKLSDSYDSLDLRDNHTIYPFLAPLLKSEQKKILNLAIFKGLNAQIALGICGLTKRQYPFGIKELHYCPVCAKEDLKKYGETYLHTVHHFPGVDICPYHQCYLETYPLKFSEDNYRQYTYLYPNRLRFEPKLCQNSHEIALAKSALELFKAKEIELSQILSLMKQTYRDRGYFKGKFFNSKKLYLDLISYYGEDYLGKKNSLLTDKQFKNPKQNYLYHFQLEHKKLYLPYQFLLLCNFFYESFNQFLENPLRREIFSKKSLKCFNKAATHYGQNVVKDLNIINKKGFFKIIARCSCGMIYSTNSNDLEKIKVLQYGQQFFRKIQEKLSLGTSIKDIAKDLSVAPNTVRRILSGKTDPTIVDNKIKTYREYFLSLLQKNPLLKVRDLYKYDYEMVYFLDRYDHDWFHNHLSLYTKKETKSYEQIDKEMKVKTKQVIQELKETNPKERITKKKILEYIKLTPTKLLRYPETLSLINHERETILDYYVRQVKPILKQIKVDEQRITKNLIQERGFNHSFETKNGKILWNKIKNKKI